MTTLIAGVLLAGIVLYGVFGGADFGTGLWDLTAGGARRGAQPRASDRAPQRAGGCRSQSMTARKVSRAPCTTASPASGGASASRAHSSRQHAAVRSP